MKEKNVNNKIKFLIGGILAVALIFVIVFMITYNSDSKEKTVNVLSTEKAYLEGKLSDMGSVLGWIGITSDTTKINKNGTLLILETNSNILNSMADRQQLVMEYILKDENNYSKFKTFAYPALEADEYPTGEYTISFLGYDDFNAVYKKFFGTEFDMNKAYRAEKEVYDGTQTASALKTVNAYISSNDFVYYENKRSGNNGFRVTSFDINSIVQNETTKAYTAKLTVNYSERAAELIGKAKGTATLQYKKEINGNITLVSYVINK